MIFLLLSLTWCRCKGHSRAIDGDGYYYCTVCQQSLNWATNQPLGWLDYDYFPAGQCSHDWD
jgi:hypothetical protein